jgi:cytochrome c oxidase cbb3-type subunit 3
MKLINISLLVLILSSCSVFNKLKTVNETNPYVNDPQSVQRGKVVFEKNCVACHGKQGLGDGATAKQMNLKPTNLVKYAKNQPANNVALHVTHGKWNIMPDFKKSLSKKEIWDVTNYVHSLGK